MQRVIAIWKQNRLSIVLLIAAIIVLPVIAAMSAPVRVINGTPTPAPKYSGVKLPSNYRADYVHYATIQRPDGTIRNVYINAEALIGIDQGYLLPNDTTIVIDGNYAKRDANGALIIDKNGHYTPGEPFDMIHVRQKRNYWLPSDFVSDVRNGNWNFGSFDTQSGAPYDESISACFNCHHASEQLDFLFTYPQLVRYAVTGETVYFICNLTGRSSC